MKLTIMFQQENPDFDKEYAKQYHFGKESENNWRYLVKEGITETNIDKVFLEEGEFELRGKKDDIEFNYKIPEVYLLKGIKNEKTVTLVVVSKELTKKIHNPYNEKYNFLRYYFYFVPKSEFISIEGQYYILKKDFPPELLE